MDEERLLLCSETNCKDYNVFHCIATHPGTSPVIKLYILAAALSFTRLEREFRERFRFKTWSKIMFLKSIQRLPDCTALSNSDFLT
jgi:hypothetical protein